MNYKHRIRMTGLAVQDGRVLMVKHFYAQKGTFRWAIPGGGLENADPDIFRSVEREMLEETGLEVRAGDIQYVSEYTSHSEQVLMLHVWVRCFPAHGDRFGEAHINNVVEGDNIVGLQWWGKDDFLTAKERADAPLFADAFWDNIDNVGRAPVHLGRWGD
jgi:ADP-ribose pyrophosphatase YjhB (NUDIX family)